MNKKILIIFPIVVTVISVLVFILMGAHDRIHMEVPLLLSIVVLLFLKVSKYNRKLKKHRHYEQGGKVPTTFDKEVTEYKNFQRTLNILIVEMFVVYFVALQIISLIV